MNLESYWALSRTHTYSLLFAVPLLMLYEGLAALMSWRAAEGRAVRNLADAILRGVLGRFGLHSAGAVISVLLIAALIVVFHEWRSRPVPIQGWVFAGMLAESVVLAVLFGAVIGRLTAAVLAPLGAAGGGGPALLAAAAQGGGLTGGELTIGQQLVLSLGAGIYEELLFRVLLVGAGAWAIARAGLLEPREAAIAAAVIAALIFSLVHYVGPYGDAFAFRSFLFRFLGGLAFSVIYVLRGFGIVTWTHALYDVLLLLALGRR